MQADQLYHTVCQDQNMPDGSACLSCISFVAVLHLHVDGDLVVVVGSACFKCMLIVLLSLLCMLYVHVIVVGPITADQIQAKLKERSQDAL
mgnify:CR=1 FL=1